jgi:TonB family protein
MKGGEDQPHQDKREYFKDKERRCSLPVYPKIAISSGWEGTVTLGLLISESGRVEKTKVINSSGHSELDYAAADALRLCHFIPGTQDGKPVESWLKMQWVWKLN